MIQDYAQEYALENRLELIVWISKNIMLFHTSAVRYIRSDATANIDEVSSNVIGLEMYDRSRNGVTYSSV